MGWLNDAFYVSYFFLPYVCVIKIVFINSSLFINVFLYVLHPTSFEYCCEETISNQLNFMFILVRRLRSKVEQHLPPMI